MSWLDRVRNSLPFTTKRDTPDNLWIKCPSCKEMLFTKEYEDNLSVCPRCEHHGRIGADARFAQLLDPGFEVLPGPKVKEDPLKFRDQKKYRDRIAAAQKTTNEKDALVVMQGKVKGLDVVVAAFEFKYMGGSMGSVVGERFVRAVNAAIEHNIPMICFSASGGARMQEALTSLMQMSKTSAALARMARRGVPFVSVVTDPTMGGVSASFAMLGDVIVGEPNALVGFAGPRVIEQTVRETLPEGFQRSEFLLEKGAIDMIVDRREMRDRLSSLMAILAHKPSPA